MKNTIDTLDTPKWMQGMKKPKWMGGGVEGHAGDESGSRPEFPSGRSNSDVRRWFGNNNNGRIRL
jgi:hypothetical protein